MRRIARPSFSATAVGVATVLSVGCYTYTPVNPNATLAGQLTRVKLTDAGSFAVAKDIGPYGDSLDGRVTQKDDSGLVISVVQVTRRGGVEETWRGESVRVANSDVASIAVPKFSRSRSSLLAGGIVATALGLAATLGAGSALSNSGRGGGSGSR